MGEFMIHKKTWQLRVQCDWRHPTPRISAL